MDSFILSSTGLYDIDANTITSDNITVISSLTVSGTNILSSLGNINTNINNINNDINNINSSIGSTSSSLNITGATNINFNVNNNLFTKINQSGLSIFHDANEIFPFNYPGWYNVADRLNNLYHVMSDTPANIINFDASHNTVIRIREQDIVNQPRQLQIQSYQGTSFSKFDIQGLQVLDINNNWYYINKMFTMTNNSILLCSNNIKVDSEGQLNVQNVVTNYVLGIATGTTGTWFSVKNSIMNSISGVSSLSTRCDNILADLTTISGNASNIANVANYYSGLQSSIAVTNGVVSTAGLILAFDLKQDKFDVKLPLSLRDPIAPAFTSHEYYKQLELKFNTTLLLDTGVLSINTREFLCPTYGDLAMISTPDNITTSTSLSYVVIKNISQPMTCMSSLNVSGYTTLNNNVTCMNNLNVNGILTCSSINSTTINNLTLNISKKTTIGSNINNFDDSSLEVNKNLIIRNNVTNGSSILLQTGTYYDASYILMEEGKDMTISTSINSTSQSMLNLISNKCVNINSSLNITGKTIIGTDVYNRSDSVFEVYKNLSIRKNISGYGDKVDLQTGIGYNASFFTMLEGSDINISTPNNATSQSIISLTSNKAVNLTAPKTYISNDCVIYGSLSCLNVGKKSPIYFTTNRNININGTTFSCYDINLNKYVKFMLLDGYNTRNFRLRTWLADGDVQNINMRIIRADIFMTDRGGLNIWALCSPVPNDNLNSTDIYLDQFLYRDTFNNIIYCSRFGSKKVYCIFEDLL